ncbi:MAG: crossover junction endodeoxyribonuclease RuvC [Marinilabiliales bacterium]|nr:MAG: crossover junction endodeoxyribonuclease RuvC [Marinilabiliales bacterium]
MAKERIILGIDPGTNIMGYGLILQKANKISLIALGILKLGKYDTHALKLKKIFERTLSLIEEYKPDEMALEAPFFGKNVQSMLKLGRAQGVAMAAGLYKDLPIFEYSPKKIKQSITGNGNASKEQVAGMLKSLVQFEAIPKHLDATDGLAAAVCHFFQGDNTTSGKSYSSWGSFLKDNPDRKG